jgi:hypothetical protein|tara:strand:+ start:2454 stop:2723 length:270 start_codon:yes stop_codon:yes gene_type:complete
MTDSNVYPKIKRVLPDEINKPVHYNNNNLETIELIKGSMTSFEFEGYLKGNVLKYIGRYRHKHKEDPVKDLHKAEWYLKRLINELTKNT